VSAVGDFLRRWGITPQKPIKRAYEQRPEAIKQWLEAEYPAIEKRAKAEGGEIHWGKAWLAERVEKFEEFIFQAIRPNWIPTNG
jgi:hypothetical protein